MGRKLQEPETNWFPNNIDTSGLELVTAKLVVPDSVVVDNRYLTEGTESAPIFEYVGRSKVLAPGNPHGQQCAVFSGLDKTGLYLARATNTRTSGPNSIARGVLVLALADPEVLEDDNRPNYFIGNNGNGQFILPGVKRQAPA